MERLEQDQGKIGTLVDETETKITEITEEMDKLKKVLYSKFGNAINLER
jgi:prefoldin subunit 4